MMSLQMGHVRKKVVRWAYVLMIVLGVLTVLAVISTVWLRTFYDFADGVPESISSYPLASRGRVNGSSADSLLVVYTRPGPTDVQIAFAGGPESLGGRWAYTYADVTAEGAISGTFYAEPRQMTMSWGNDISENPRNGGFKKTHPSFHVALPITDLNRHEWINLSAAIDIVYPGPGKQARTFANTTAHLEKRLLIFLLAPEDVILWSPRLIALRIMFLFLGIGLVCGGMALGRRAFD